jgi:diguanylate cyclase (GGDEF)-like protein
VNLHIAHLPKLVARRRSSAILGMTIIAMLWVGITVKYFERASDDLSEAERTNQNFAMVFEENVLRSLGELDKALLYLRRSIETRKDSTDFQTIIQTTDVLSEIIVQEAIIDANGIMRATNVGPQPAPPINLSDREHYKVHVHSTEDKLFISTPVVGRASGQWSVQVTRRFLNRDGSFGGVVVASLNPAHFTKFYDKIDFGSTAAISLTGSDGVVRSSGGSAVGRYALGQDLTGTRLFKYIETGRDATFEDKAAANGETMMVTARKVRGYPLWVSVSVKKSDVLKGSWTGLEGNALAGLALTLILLTAMEQILRTEAKAEQKAQQLHLTLEHMSQGIMLVTKDLQIPIINRKCGELLNLPGEFIDHPPRFDQIAQYQPQHDADPNAGIVTGITALEDDATNGVAGQGTVFKHTRADGAVLEVRSTPLPDGSFVQTFTDITKRCEAEAHVTRLASEDPLTGLPNRRVFSSAIDRISRQALAAGGGSDSKVDFAVLFLDLDRFKVINDTLGHRVGDMLLIEVAQRLRRCLRPCDVLARLGGDEFAVVLPSFDSRVALEAMANAICEAINQPYEIDGHRIRSSVSIGIAIGPHDGENADDLLMATDLALYAVKASGRGTYRFYQRLMNEDVKDRRQIEMDLREAIDRGQLELHYQPIIDLRRNVVTGFEALARWNHPVKGMISPAVFIPIAEDSGLILPLGEWALTEACRRAAQWPDHLNIAVNLSPVQFSTPNLSDVIERVLAHTQLSPQRLVLEITERIFMADNEETLVTLYRLKNLGVSISMDDFGTGYSSLSYLRSFPFDKIKIDRAFVSDLGEGSENGVIVQAVIIIARALGMNTIAEGVETAAQQRLLSALGCDEAQGFHLGRPVPIEKVPEVIAKWSDEKPASEKILAA